MPRLHASRTFQPLPETVKEARDFVGCFLRTVGASPDALAAGLVCVSELATNSLRHARSVYRVDCFDDEDGFVRIGVHDTSPQLPTPRSASDDDEDGRGLAIVGLLARLRTYRESSGKLVVAEIKKV